MNARSTRRAILAGVTASAAMIAAYGRWTVRGRYTYERAVSRIEKRAEEIAPIPATTPAGRGGANTAVATARGAGTTEAT